MERWRRLGPDYRGEKLTPADPPQLFLRRDAVQVVKVQHCIHHQGVAADSFAAIHRIIRKQKHVAAAQVCQNYGGMLGDGVGVFEQT